MYINLTVKSKLKKLIELTLWNRVTAECDFHPIKLTIFPDIIQIFTRFCTDFLRLSDEECLV